MPFKTFTASALTASDVNTYLAKQAVITCTSGTRPASPVQGMQIYETDTDMDAYYNGSAWVYKGGWSSYTVSAANATTGNGTLTGLYTRIGKTIHFNIVFTLGSTSTIGTTPAFTLPVTAAASNAGFTSGIAFDASGGATGRLPLSALLSTTTVTPLGSGGLLAATVPFTWTTSDILTIGGTYQAA